MMRRNLVILVPDFDKDLAMLVPYYGPGLIASHFDRVRSNEDDLTGYLGRHRVQARANF